MTAATTTKPTTNDRPVFVLELRPEPGVDPVLALRALLKAALRIAMHLSTRGEQQ
jgi:hypothetical protein